MKIGVVKPHLFWSKTKIGKQLTALFQVRKETYFGCMKFKPLLYLSVLLLSFFTKTTIGQSLPQIRIPYYEVQKAFGVKPGENFALVYKGDTLASYISDGKTSSKQFFEETISCKNYKDSLEYNFSLPNKKGTYRLSLPDSVLIFSKELQLSDSTISVVRYSSDGTEKYRMNKRDKNTTITYSSKTCKRVTNIYDKRWEKRYIQLQPDSSYYRSYNQDSVLAETGYVANRISGERISWTQRESPFHYVYSKTYYVADSSYNYRLSIDSERDTSISESTNRKFTDIDSTFFCRDWIAGENFGYGKIYTSSGKDSTYKFGSQDGGTIEIVAITDSLEVYKSYNLFGEPVYRSIMKMLDDDYGVEEILEKRDTFYHVINYYHQLYWDKDYITAFFPFYKQVFFDEDSIVIRELNYSFEQQDEWPVLTIKEGDSVRVVSTTEGADSKYAVEVGICGLSGSRYERPPYSIEESSFRYEGAGNDRVKRRILKNSKKYIKLKYGVGRPPLYFIYLKDSEYYFHSFKSRREGSDQSFLEILRTAKPQKVTLYVEGKPKVIEAIVLRLDYDFSPHYSEIISL